MNQLQIFYYPDFGQVRSVNENGTILFCENDVAKALGYAVPRKTLFDHCKGVLKRNVPTNRGVAKMETPGGIQEITIINESGLYSLILSSKLPSAKAFKR